MTPEQRFDFDVNGYTVIRSALSQDQVRELLDFWDSRLQGLSLFDLSFSWGKAWADLIDHPPVLEVLKELFGGRPRLDHGFGVTEAFVSSRGRLHHHSMMGDQGIYYAVQGQRMLCGMVGVSYALMDIPEGSGGFCCVPGSHRANFPTPDEYFDVARCPHVKRVSQRAGDALVFSEGLTHGTYPAREGFVRRTLLLRYVPGHMAFRQPASAPLIERLPHTPNYDHDPSVEGRIDPAALTSQQRLMACEQPYVRGRRTLAPT